jgi:hypothetical protein
MTLTKSIKLMPYAGQVARIAMHTRVKGRRESLCMRREDVVVLVAIDAEATVAALIALAGGAFLVVVRAARVAHFDSLAAARVHRRRHVQNAAEMQAQSIDWLALLIADKRNFTV